MRKGYTMTIRWWRRACDGAPQFLEDRPQAILQRNWRALNQFHVTRLRLNAQAAVLERCIANAK